MPYRDDNEALRAQVEVMETELKDAAAKNAILNKKLNRVRVGNAAIVALMIASATVGFIGGVKTHWSSKCDRQIADGPAPTMDQKCCIHAQNDSVSSYLALSNEKYFLQNLLESKNYKAGPIWQKAIKYARVSTKYLPGYESCSIHPIMTESAVIDDEGIDYYLVVGEQLNSPYFGYEIKPKMEFYLFWRNMNRGVKLVINPDGSDEYWYLAVNSQRRYWELGNPKNINTPIKEYIFDYWTKALKLNELNKKE